MNESLKNNDNKIIASYSDIVYHKILKRPIQTLYNIKSKYSIDIV